MRVRLNSTVQGLLEDLKVRFPRAGSDVNDLLIQGLTVLLHCPQQIMPPAGLPTAPTAINFPTQEPEVTEALGNLFDFQD